MTAETGGRYQPEADSSDEEPIAIDVQVTAFSLGPAMPDFRTAFCAILKQRRGQVPQPYRYVSSNC